MLCCVGGKLTRKTKTKTQQGKKSTNKKRPKLNTVTTNKGKTKVQTSNRRTKVTGLKSSKQHVRSSKGTKGSKKGSKSSNGHKSSKSNTKSSKSAKQDKGDLIFALSSRASRVLCGTGGKLPCFVPLKAKQSEKKAVTGGHHAEKHGIIETLLHKIHYAHLWWVTHNARAYACLATISAVV